MSSIVISGDTSGAITLAAPAVSGTNTATLPSATGTVMVSGNMPAFSAYSNANQTLSSAVQTKAQLQSKDFDTANAFDSTTNYRFTPQVAGYYQINGQAYCNGTALSYAWAAIFKNGGVYKIGSTYNGTAISEFSSTVSSVVYLNGSTDYIELYVTVTATSPKLIGGADFYTYLSGALVRAA